MKVCDCITGLLCLCILCMVQDAGAEPLVYQRGKSWLHHSMVSYLPAGEPAVPLQEARKKQAAGEFIANTLPDINLGIARDNYWVYFRVVNASDAERLIVSLENPRLNEVDVYILSGDSLQAHHKLGDSFPYADRVLPFNLFSFPLNLQHTREVEVFLLLRHKGNTLQMPVMISNEGEFLSYVEIGYLQTGSLTGIFIIAFLFSIFFLINTRDLLFLYYGGYIFCAAVWLWATEGYGFQYLWPTHTELATRLGPGVSAMSASFFVANCLQFVKPYDTTSLYRKVLTGIWIFLSVWCLLPMIPWMPLTPATMSVYLTGYFSANLITAFFLIFYFTWLYRRGNKVVLYYFLAVTVTLICSYLVIFRGFGYINIPVSSGILMGTGYVIEIALMTAGITKQFYLYKKEKEDTLIAYLEQQKSINARILETQEQERRRIGRELHDDIGSGLTQITLMSEAARHQASGGAPGELNEIAQTSRHLVNQMGEIIWSLDPGNRSPGQLFIYLREQLGKLLEYANLSYRISFPDPVPDLPMTNTQMRNVFLAVKEAVHNAVKHSRATEITVEAQLVDSTLHFVVADNGTGIEGRNGSGHGLRNMQRRMEEVGGTFEMQSSPGKGTRITITTFITLPDNKTVVNFKPA